MRIATSLARMGADEHAMVQLKAGRAIEASWEKQVLNYLRATEGAVGVLFNFGPKAEFKRCAFENSNKNSRKSARIRADEVVGGGNIPGK